VGTDFLISVYIAISFNESHTQAALRVQNSGTATAHTRPNNNDIVILILIHDSLLLVHYQVNDGGIVGAVRSNNVPKNVPEVSLADNFLGLLA
jgi:hypothetical protein